MEGIVIREAVPDDIDAIRDVQRLTWIATYPNEAHGITREDVETKFREDPTLKINQERRERRKQTLFSPPLHSWVALERTSIVGICTVKRDEHENQLQMLYILPDFQGKGIGKRLMQTALDWFGAEQEVELDVASYNEKAIAFYRAFGFVARRPVPEAQASVLPSGIRIPTIIMVRKAQVIPNFFI